jgi:hypothetical protein
MINKKQNSSNNRKGTATEEKRFSKSKFKKDNVTLEDKREENAQVMESTTLRKTAEDYRQEYAKEMEKRRRNLVAGETESVRTAILSKPSLEAYGYSVLPKGQCVTVTTYVGAGYRKVRATDGRVGLIPLDGGIK